MASHCYEKERFHYESFSNNQVKFSVFGFHQCQKCNPTGEVENRLHLKIFRVSLLTKQSHLCKYTSKCLSAYLYTFKHLQHYF